MKLLKVFDPDIRQKNIEAVKTNILKKYFRLQNKMLVEPIFIIGCSRSGTTVTFETITASHEVRSFGYELPQMWNALYGPKSNGWHSEAAYRENADAEHGYEASASIFARLGVGRIVDKTCINVLRVPYLFELFPDAKFLYIYRDGPDNISSLMDGWRDGRFDLRQFLGDFPEEISINNNEFNAWHFFLPPGWRTYNTKSLEAVCTYQWSIANELALSAKEEIPESQWVELRYEEIFSDPVAMYKRAFEKLDLQFTSEIRDRCASLSSRPTSIVLGRPQKEKWRTQNPDAIERVIESMAPMRRRLGYV